MLAIDLFCGLGGWAEGFLAEGWDIIGFDIERHDYGTGAYPGQLVLQDVTTLHGSQFKDAACIVASPPCQAYSYRAMPWKRAKALPPPSNELFDACFRIQREACEAAGHHIPLIVENVRGAQPWVGRAKWNFGSYYLWGDVPGLMPTPFKGFKSTGLNWSDQSKRGQDFTRIAGRQSEGRKNDGSGWTPNGSMVDQKRMVPYKVVGIKQAGISGPRNNGKGDRWFQDGAARHGSRSNSRKAASAMIAKIPFPLAQHIARVFKGEF